MWRALIQQVALAVGLVIGGIARAITRGWGAEAVFVAGLVGHGAHMFLQPFLSACWILLYYDLRIRKEGFNLEMMAKSLGTPLPTQPSA